MRTMTAVFLACGVAAGIAQAQPITVSLTGDLNVTEGIDPEGYHGAAFVMTATIDGSGTWQDRFGLPMAVATASSLSIGGSALAFNESVAFYPTYAGAFSDPDGLQLTFNASGGSLMQFIGNMTAAPGAADAVVGGSIELDDFTGALYLGTLGADAVIDVAGGTYTLDNAVFTAVPTPAGAALLGLAGLVAARRRR